MILSGNAIDHALLTLGGFLAGVPVVPVSPAYSLMSQDYGKVKHIAALVKPGLVYAADAAPFGGVLSSRRLRRRRDRPLQGHRRDRVRRPGGHARDGRGGRRARRGRPGQPGQGALHLGLDRDAQGRAEHPPDAGRQPAEPRPDLAVHRGHAAGARRLAAVEPHVRRQPQLQPDPQARRHAVHRRRPARPAADRNHGAQPDRHRADDLLQRARGLRRAAAVPGARRRAARPLLRAPGPDLLRRRRAAAGPVDAAGGGVASRARRAGDDDLLLGADRDVAARHGRALPDRPRGGDRRAGAGRRDQAHAGRGQARDARQGPERHRAATSARPRRPPRPSTRTAGTGRATPASSRTPTTPTGASCSTAAWSRTSS